MPRRIPDDSKSRVAILPDVLDKHSRRLYLDTTDHGEGLAPFCLTVGLKGYRP
jgi:hypothetical protein